MASASSWVKFPRSYLAFFGEGSIWEHGKATIRDFKKGKADGGNKTWRGDRVQDKLFDFFLQQCHVTDLRPKFHYG